MIVIVALPLFAFSSAETICVPKVAPGTVLPAAGAAPEEPVEPASAVDEVVAEEVVAAEVDALEDDEVALLETAADVVVPLLQAPAGAERERPAEGERREGGSGGRAHGGSP